MKRTFWVVAAAALSLAASASAAPLESYGRLPVIEDVAVSPDGQHIAISATTGEQRRILVRKTADDSLVFAMNAGDQKMRDVRWAGPNHIAVTTSQTTSVMDLTGPRREWFTAVVVDVRNQKVRRLLDRVESSMNVVIGEPKVRTVNGKTYIYAQGIHFIDETGLLSVFRHEVNTGKTELVEAADKAIDDWEISPGGVPFAKSLYEQEIGRWTVRLKTDAGWKPIETHILPFGSPRLSGLGRSDASVVTWVLADSGDTWVLREYSPNGAVDLPNEFDSLLFDPATHRLIGGYELVGEEGRHTFFDPTADAAWKSIARVYKGQIVRLVSWSDSRRQVVVRVDDPAAGPAYAIVDLDAKTARWLGEAYAGLKPEDIAEVKSVAYKAADGTNITGYLTLPRGRDPKNLPLVVLPHGGPASRDTPGFDWWSQALASRGYAVLQPNFRGSTGFGLQFLEAGFGEWGRKMQTDVSDGVKHLAKEGVIDPKRVCIVGASYGGYAALAGVTLENGVYRCSVSVAGVSDLRRMLETNNRGSSGKDSRTRYWTRFWGVEDGKSPDLTPISPARQAARADAPILLIHGKDDTVVPYDQTRLMADALGKAGKKFELVTLNGEDHWLSRGDTRLQMLQATVAFLEKENPPH
jgi:dipeptidyl aminopeptidase/acylaminoacyl peptidase